MSNDLQKTLSIQIATLGNGDDLPYQKADITKACRVSESFAISFYQLDYQAIANAFTNAGSTQLSASHLLPITKIVMDKSAFYKLKAEIDEIASKVSATESK